jgi:predicted P-loop ATPase
VPKFENLSISIPRMMIFGGSTNDRGILYDTTGNRRFWCVESMDYFDRDLLIKIKEELWSESYQAYLKNPNPENWTLNAKERDLLEVSNEKFQADDPLASSLTEALSDRGDNKISVHEINKLAKNYDKNAHPNTVKKIMENVLGWTKGQFTSGPQKGNRCYIRPEMN